MPSLLHLTPVHFSVYDYIVKYKQRHDGGAPTYLEISKACQIRSTSQVHPILSSLALFGMIKFDYHGRSRMITVPGGRWSPPIMDSLFSTGRRVEHGTLVKRTSVSSP